MGDRRLSPAHRKAISRSLRQSRVKFRYPFNKWLFSKAARRGTLLLRSRGWNKHFSCTIPGMMQQLRTAASVRRLKISLKAVWDGPHGPGIKVKVFL